MITDELTVFDVKYNEGMERLNNLLSSESYSNSIKNFVERYKLDKSLEKRNSQKNNKTNNIGNTVKEDKRKQIVDIYEIRDHDKKVQHYMNKNYLKNEIEWFKIKKREDEHKNKYSYNRSKLENDSLNKYNENKDIIRINNLKMKKFSNLANKVNIEKFKQIKKLNQNNNLNSEGKNKAYDQNNNFQEGVFIPYSEYKELEKNNNNKGNTINIRKINYNTYKSQNINNNSKNTYRNNNNINNKNNNTINLQQNKILYANKIRNKTSQTKNKNNIPINNENNKSNSKNISEKELECLKLRKERHEERVKIYKTKNLFKDQKNKNNIELLNFQSKNYEDKAKMQEQLMRVKRIKKYGNDDNIKLSNLLIDSISTKLAILNEITDKNN